MLQLEAYKLLVKILSAEWPEIVTNVIDNTMKWRNIITAKMYFSKMKRGLETKAGYKINRS